MDKSSREKLHNKLLDIVENVYFQPPANIKLTYPCIIYRKTPGDRKHANDKAYISAQGFTLTVIERDPDTPIKNETLDYFSMISEGTSFTVDGLYHSQLTLYHY